MGAEGRRPSLVGAAEEAVAGHLSRAAEAAGEGLLLLLEVQVGAVVAVVLRLLPQGVGEGEGCPQAEGAAAEGQSGAAGAATTLSRLEGAAVVAEGPTQEEQEEEELEKEQEPVLPDEADCDVARVAETNVRGETTELQR